MYGNFIASKEKEDGNFNGLFFREKYAKSGTKKKKNGVTYRSTVLFKLK